MRRRVGLSLVVAIAVLLVAAPAIAAQTILVQNLDTTAYPKVSFTMAVPSDAATADGRPPQVTLVENGAPIKDVVVSSLVEERGPIDVVLVIDTSGSMKGQPLADAQSAARRFVESMEPKDHIALVAFSSQPRLVRGFTNDRAVLASDIDGLQASGETALYDALVESAKVADASSAAERYVVALSDGGDTLSINSPDNAVKALKRAGAPVYAVALESPEYKPATLATIAKASGGRMTTARGSASLTSIYESISSELQLRYRVTYTSTRPSTPELDIFVTLGTGADAPTARTTVSNPLFDASAGNAPTALLPAKPSPAAMGTAIVLTFASVLLLVLALGLAFQRDHAAMEQLEYYDQLRSRGASERSGADPTTSGGRLLRFMGEIAEQRGFTGLVQRRLEAAGLALRANEYIFFHILLTIAVGLLANLLSGGMWLLVIAATLIAVFAPIAFLQTRARRRRDALEEELPDILNLIAGSLRSGWGIQQALDLVVDEVGDPARSEFRRVQAESRLGLPLEDALHRMANRVDSEDLRWTVSAISIQREVGGNLSEVLNTVARTIRERAELKRSVSALTAEGRYSAVVLTLMPFVMFGGLLLVSTDYALQLLNTGIGRSMLILGGTLLAIGTFWINRVVNVEV